MTGSPQIDEVESKNAVGTMVLQLLQLRRRRTSPLYNLRDGAMRSGQNAG
jgi:hypothetical protein